MGATSLTSTLRQPPVLKLNLGLEKVPKNNLESTQNAPLRPIAVPACVRECVTGVPGPSGTAMALMDGLASPFPFSLGALIWSQSQPWVVASHTL